MKYVSLKKRIDLANTASARNSLQRYAIRATFSPLRVKISVQKHELVE